MPYGPATTYWRAFASRSGDGPAAQIPSRLTSRLRELWARLEAGLELIGDVDPAGDPMRGIGIGVRRLPAMDPDQEFLTLRRTQDLVEHVLDKRLEVQRRSDPGAHDAILAATDESREPRGESPSRTRHMGESSGARPRNHDMDDPEAPRSHGVPVEPDMDAVRLGQPRLDILQ